MLRDGPDVVRARGRRHRRVIHIVSDFGGGLSDWRPRLLDGNRYRACCRCRRVRSGPSEHRRLAVKDLRRPWLRSVTGSAVSLTKGKTLKPETLEFAKYVIVCTTFPAAEFSPAQVLQRCRLRWQVERVLKRFKSIAQLGHLPKYHPESAKAWLYGKLFTALLTKRLIHHAVAISPWGYEL
ncbi:MAG: transposase [Aestuariivita sp.]|nr:transposase [Aestuariivita sp.]MCY4347473.1 transposase [Aestuariivita sp.]